MTRIYMVIRILNLICHKLVQNHFYKYLIKISEKNYVIILSETPKLINFFIFLT